MKQKHIETYRVIQTSVSIPQAGWKWQRRGAVKLVAIPTLKEKWHLLNKDVLKLSERQGALGVTPRSNNYIYNYTRSDAQYYLSQYGLELIPKIGGDSGPWYTKSA